MFDNRKVGFKSSKPPFISNNHQCFDSNGASTHKGPYLQLLLILKKLEAFFPYVHNQHSTSCQNSLLGQKNQRLRKYYGGIVSVQKVKTPKLEGKHHLHVAYGNMFFFLKESSKSDLVIYSDWKSNI
jgi:hypothetical protein